MNQFFNPSPIVFDPNKPQEFQYAQLAEALKRQGMPAQALQAINPDFGNVRVGKGTSTLAILAQALGGYMNGVNQRQQGQLDEANKKAEAHYMDLLFKDPQGYVDDAKKNSYAYTYNKPEDVGPPVLDNAQGPGLRAQSFPVKSTQGPIETAPLPKSPVGMAARVQGTPQQTYSPARDSQRAYENMGQGKAKEEFSIIAPGAWDNLKRIGGEAAGRIKSGLATVRDFTGADGSQIGFESKPAAAPTAPAATPATVPAPQARTILPPPSAAQAAPAPATQAPQAAVEQPTFNVDTQTILGNARRAASADQLAAMKGLMTTKNGGPLANAILMQRLGGKGGPKYNVTSLGDGRYVKFDEKTGESVEGRVGGSGTQSPEKSSEMRIKLTPMIREASDSVNLNKKALTAIERAEKAVMDWDPSVGGTIGQFINWAARNLGNESAQNFKNALEAVSLDNLKAIFGANTSNVELLTLAGQFGTDGSVTRDVLLARLQQMKQQALNGQRAASEQLNSLNSEYKLWGGGGSQPKEQSLADDLFPVR